MQTLSLLSIMFYAVCSSVGRRFAEQEMHIVLAKVNLLPDLFSLFDNSSFSQWHCDINNSS